MSRCYLFFFSKTRAYLRHSDSEVFSISSLIPFPCYHHYLTFRLVKVGVLPSSWGHRLSRISAGSELIGYVASISLTILRIHNLLEREVALIAELQRRRREKSLRATYATLYGGNAVASLDSTLTEDEKEHALVSEIRALRSRRALRTLSLAQDVADMCLAIADVRGAGTGTSRGLLSNRAFLAAAGLLSGCISAYKNWPGVMK